MWELGIFISASSSPKAFYLASVVYLHKNWPLFSKDFTEKPSADFQRMRVRVSLLFSLCKASLPTAVSANGSTHLPCLLGPCLSLLLRKTLRLWLASPSPQAGSCRHSLWALHLLPFSQGTVNCLLFIVRILLFHIFVWFSGCFKVVNLVLGRKSHMLYVYKILNSNYHGSLFLLSSPLNIPVNLGEFWCLLYFMMLLFA